LKALDELFQGLSLEEPSASVDRRIFGFVKSALARRRRAWLAHLGSAAALGAAAAAAAALVFFWPGGLFGPHHDSAGSVAEAAPLEAIEELRGDLDQIQEMSELIPPDRQTDQALISDKIRACLAELEKLEVELRTVSVSSPLGPPEGTVSSPLGPPEGTVSSPLAVPSPSLPEGKVPEGTVLDGSLLSEEPGKGVNL
jgi:hypothetical protein